MPEPREIEARFWSALKSEMTAMLGLVSAEEGHAQPMTAQIGDRDGRGPIWFFTAKDNDLVQAMGEGAPAALQFVANWNPVSVLAAASRRLLGDPDPAATIPSWPMQHPELASALWSLGLMAVVMPLAVWLCARRNQR